MMRSPSPHHPAVRLARTLALALAGTTLVAACGVLGAPSPAASSPASPAASVPLPTPTCGGIRIAIEGSLPCDEVVQRATTAVAASNPELLGRGVLGIKAFLNACNEDLPPRIPCGGERYAQYVTFTFARGPEEQIEPQLTVAVSPTSGSILGLADPVTAR